MEEGTSLDRNRLIRRLREAKKAHRRWVSNAQILMQGIPVRNDQLPLNETECGFGQWYYGDGQALREYEVFRAIEAPHRRLHALYLDIFHLLFRERKVSLLGRLLGRKATPTQEELEQARALFADLNRESLRIMDLLDELEAVIAGMDEEEFSRLFA